MAARPSFASDDALPTTITGVSGSAVVHGTDTLTATLSGGGAGLSGQTVVFAVNGVTAGHATTSSAGTATLTVPTGNSSPGTYTGAVTATFVGTGTDLGSSATGTLTVLSNGAAAHITITGGASQTVPMGLSPANAFQATVKDKYGNPVPGESSPSPQPRARARSPAARRPSR